MLSFHPAQGQSCCLILYNRDGQLKTPPNFHSVIQLTIGLLNAMYHLSLKLTSIKISVVAFRVALLIENHVDLIDITRSSNTFRISRFILGPYFYCVIHFMYFEYNSLFSGISFFLLIYRISIVQTKKVQTRFSSLRSRDFFFSVPRKVI